MSRFCPEQPQASGRILSIFSCLPLWHGLCISLCSTGCFFWPPFVEVHPNAPPVIEYSSPEADNVFRIDTSQGGVAWVSVYDDDEGDVMDYLWTINGLGPQGSATSFVSGNYQGSTITLPQDPIYHGRVLTCTVFDTAGASARRTWTIQVETGA